MIKAACTVVSLNYLPYARTLCESFLEFHPDCNFYVLLVDRIPANMDISKERYQLVLVEELGLSNFDVVAFKFGILELNTNVKPTFLKRLLAQGIDQLVYFDPDILVCSPIDLLYRSLENNSIVITPHCTSANEGDPYSEVLLLSNGVYNLGFVAVSRTVEAELFLSWWEQRCLSLGYDERWAGLFVDQKWINLVPCYFNSVLILKHPGCNVAYWNLHERTLTGTASSWIVNGKEPLVFFHFSGISVDGGTRISKHTDQFDLVSRPDLEMLFQSYRERLVAYGIRETHRLPYAFGTFDDGTPVTKLLRAALAANLDTFGDGNPFNAKGPFYRWASQRHLLSHGDSVGKYGRKAYDKRDSKVKIVNGFLRMALRVLGPDRYTILMKYFEFASLLRNQKDIFGDVR
jgi:hypothetical protein